SSEGRATCLLISQAVAPKPDSAGPFFCFFPGPLGGGCCVAPLRGSPASRTGVPGLPQAGAQVGPVWPAVRVELEAIVAAAGVVDVVEVAPIGRAEVGDIVILPRPAPLVIEVGIIRSGRDRVDLVLPPSVGVGAEGPVTRASGDVLVGPVEVAKPADRLEVLGLLDEPAVGGQCEEGIIPGRAEAVEAIEVSTVIDEPPLPGRVGAVDVDGAVRADGKDFIAAKPTDAGGDVVRPRVAVGVRRAQVGAIALGVQVIDI